MLNLYLKLSLTSFKNKFHQIQLALYKSYASAQSGNPDQSWTFLCLFLLDKNEQKNSAYIDQTAP